MLLEKVELIKELSTVLYYHYFTTSYLSWHSFRHSDSYTTIGLGSFEVLRGGAGGRTKEKKQGLAQFVLDICNTAI